jgi:hypothetical protein
MKITATGRVSVFTTYSGPTNHRGSRIRVKRTDHRSGDKILTVSWDDALDTEENHVEAIRQYVEMLEWDHSDWVVGHNNNRGYIGVAVPREVTS